MSFVGNPTPSINVNLFIQNNIKIEGSSFERAKPDFFTQAPKHDGFDFKQSAKNHSSFDTDDLKVHRKFGSLVSNSLLEDSLVSTECSTPEVRSKIQTKSNEYTNQVAPSEDDNLTELLGYALIVGGCLFFVLALFSYFGSAFIDKTGHVFLDWILEDNHYCFAFPLLAVFTIVMAWLNWLAIKFFRHT
jgi:phosphatidylinositol glycan anchor class Y biosynthesis protein